MADIDPFTGNAMATNVPPSTMLRMQLNRYADSSTPKQFRLFQTKLPATGPIDFSVTSRAGAVILARLTMSTSVGSDAALNKLAGTIIGDIDGSAVRANLPLVIATVAGFADAHGLPAARLPGQLEPSTWALIIGSVLAVGAGAFYYFRKGR